MIENGVETEKFNHRVDANGLRRHLGLEGKFVVSYIGTIGYAHGLDIILQAAHRLKGILPEAMLLLVGEGAEKDKLEGRARREGLGNIRFIPQQPRDDIPRFIALSDVCLVLLRKAELFTTVLPSKMLEFMACGRPVVLGVEGQAREILDQAQAGVCIEPGEPEDLVQAVVNLYRDPALRSRLGENGRDFIVKHFSRRHKAMQYLEILGSMNGKRQETLEAHSISQRRR